MITECSVDGSRNRSINWHSVITLFTEIPKSTGTRHYEIEEGDDSFHIPDKSKDLES